MPRFSSSGIIRLAAAYMPENERFFNFTNIDGTVMSILDAPIISALSIGLGIPFNVVIPENGLTGFKDPDGTWTGAIGMLVRGEADISVSGMTASKERREVVNLTFPLYVTDITFLTNKPEPYPKDFAMIETFSSCVWVGVGLSLIITSILLYYLLKKRKPYITIFMAVMANLLENSFIEVKQKSTVSLLVFFLLGSTILTFSYKAVILSVLTFPRMVGIRDITDLAKAAEEGTVTCMTYDGYIQIVNWFETDDERFKSIGKSLTQSETRNLTNLSTFLNYSEKKAFIADRIDILKYQRHYLISEDSFALSHIVIAYSKSFCCPRKLESVLHRITAADLYAKYVRDILFRYELRLPNIEYYDSTRVTPLTLKELYGPFLVLIIGHLFSCLVFLIEIYVHKKC